MDTPSLEKDIRSAIAKRDDIKKNEKHRVSLLSAARALVQALEAPDEAISDVAVASGGRFMCVRVAQDLGLFDILAERSPQTVTQLAQQSQGEELLILRLLRSLASIGFVEEQGEDTYAATAVTKTLTKGHVKAGIIHWYDQTLPALAQVPAYFRANRYRSPTSSTTGPVQHAFSTPLSSYAYWHTQPGVMENFNTFMAGHFAGQRLSWLEWFPAQQQIVKGFDESVSEYLFIDVGGGRGHEADAVRKKFPEAHGKVVVEDLPEVIDDARGLDERIELVRHDFFKPQPIKGARAYFLSNILHNWPDDESLAILQGLQSAMTPRYSKLLIADLILPNTACPPRALGLDIGMMVLHSGIQRSERQWEGLIEKAGLKVQKFWNAPGDGDGIVEVIVKD